MPINALFEAGDVVRIRTGAFAGLEGVVLSNRGKSRVLASIRLLQQGVSMEIDDANLEVVQTIPTTVKATTTTTTTASTNRNEYVHRPIPTTKFGQCWEFFGILLSRKVRERVYEPAQLELEEDYLLCRRRYQGNRGAMVWVDFCFCCRTGILFVDCLRVGALGRLADMLIKGVPLLKRWLS
jgi:hypothetical protein